ncbi:DUF7344 domain-containing protein [Halomarina litorea]|uniref:DUF7344 domain-containing protein n=1 Tax=Halomarina litorea TaxID=2961595 RepID=UPI0020C1DA77|nr:hypothetical protein [Halomarina sp. BCD28]
MESPSDELELDDAFNILSNSRRRYILYYLYTHDEPATIDELAGQIAAWENEIPIDELDDTARRRVYVSLYQTHLPKLDDFGIADYDRDEGVVELTDRADEIVRYLPVGEREQRDFTWYYVALAGGAVVLMLGILVDVIPAGAAAIAVALGLLAVVVYQFLVSNDDGQADFLQLEDLE